MKSVKIGRALVRYVELSREVEGTDKREQPRIVAEIHVESASRWVKLAYLYTRDSYDDYYAVAIEDAWVSTAAPTGGQTPETIVTKLIPHTNARASLTEFAKRLKKNQIRTIDELVPVEKEKPKPRTKRRRGQTPLLKQPASGPTRRTTCPCNPPARAKQTVIVRIGTNTPRC